MKHLMIFSIGPVQDFIATARRSRDLWYGSWMLSELAKFAANKIVELTSFDSLIFPHPPNRELLIPASTFNAPNKIVAVVETSDPKQFANNIKEATVNYLEKELAKPTLDNIPLTKDNRELAYKQIKDLPEVYWVSVPYEEDNYKLARERAEALLTARKNTRDFKQMTGANVPKSSLDGSRESVIDEKEYPDNKKDLDTEKANKVRKLYKHYHARQGERLSGVDLLKRLGARKDKPDFKSTSHMAAIPFIEKLDKTWGKQKREEFITSIRQAFIERDWNVEEKDDGVLLYENRLMDWIPKGKDQDEIRENINKIWQDSRLGDSRPSPYYALLRADGDNMGKVIDGQTNEEQHRKLSEALSKFAEKVKNIVNVQHQGLLIYSGGDDVLAYLPVNQALGCASALEKKFKNVFRENPDDETSPIKFFAEDKTTSPTLSVGIVIAHHLDPLSDILQLAREAERKAKDEVDGKNGLAITLSKRSGVDRTILGEFSELHGRLSKLKEFFDAGLLSGGTAYELQELGVVLSDDFPLRGLRDEALRIVKRKQSSAGKEISESDKQRYIGTVESWLKNISSVKPNPKRYSLHDLANEMIIAKSFADGTEASVSPEQEANHES